jgi:hypothetical protein
MSKVIHLSDDAHNTAKGFCKQHGLKMSDWVAALIADAIAQGRVDPQAPVRAPPPPPPSPSPSHPVAQPAPQVAPVPQPPVSAVATPSGPPKKKLERFREEMAAATDGVPPWAAPPFWAKMQSKA